MPLASLAEPLVVSCTVCHASGVVDTPAEASPEQDRHAWPSLPCFFAADCLGHVWPEAVN